MAASLPQQHKVVEMKFFALLAVIALVGCASKKTEPAPAPAAPAPVVQTAPVNANKLSCTKGSETRTLEVVSKDKGCALNYTKAGKETVAASSVHGTSHCDQSKTKISKKLEAAGYQCK